jgi:2-dehydropantoate 2-reductase
MRFLVVGTGGVGGYFGGKLARHGEDVWFIARGKHLAAMQQNGLRIIAPEETFVIPPGRMTDDVRSAGKADVILFCVKSYDTEAAARTLAPALTDDSIIVCLQNGVDNEEKIQAVIPHGKVYGGAAYIYATITSPGVVTRPGGPQRIVFGSLKPDDSGSARIREGMTGAGIRADLATDIHAALWTKFIFIAAVGGMTTATRLTLAEILSIPASRAMLEDAMRETESITRAQKINVPNGIVEKMFENLKSMDNNTYSSMYHDLVNGNPLEIEAFSGTVIRYGQQLGIPTPTHRSIYAVLLPHHLKNLKSRSR